MAVYRYPQEVHDFVKEWCSRLRDRELAAACNDKFGTSFTPSGMKAFRNNHGYISEFKQWSTEEYWKYQTKYPAGMYEFIRDNSWGVSSKDMAEMVNNKFGTNFTPTGMKQFRQRNRIKSGVTGWYQKGHPPGNKGKKLEEYVGQERASKIKERMSSTMFKKGGKPLNELPVGAIVINSGGYKLRKKQMTGTLWERWEFLHRAVWAEHNGPIPDGMIVSFRDSNRLNCDIDNLMLIDKSENASLTGLGYRFSDPDLTDAGLQVIRLKKTIRNRRSKCRQQKEDPTE